MGSEESLKILKEIKEYHFNNEIGLVVCPTCHAQVDKYYKNRKNENTVN